MNDWKNKTILVAEDDLINFKLMNFMLKKTGANIVWAKNGEEAVNASKSNNIDAILMDVQMPVMNGKEAASRIRENNKEVPIIILSAYSPHELKSWSEKGLSNGILNKPVQADQLVGTIEKHFGPLAMEH
ncbi:MAG: response regulator [Prolixibacteraceae bacterium]|nr:response regulator [Prolixibacteraceae bacterium]MBN2775215.1 response regulator [Prolixibacteraceae bacterium]